MKNFVLLIGLLFLTKFGLGQQILIDTPKIHTPIIAKNIVDFSDKFLMELPNHFSNLHDTLLFPGAKKIASDQRFKYFLLPLDNMICAQPINLPQQKSITNFYWLQK